MTLAIPTVADCQARTGRFPRRLIVDRAYDADSLQHLNRHIDGELICLNRYNRKRGTTRQAFCHSAVAMTIGRPRPVTSSSVVE
jgi:hypothetical protein